MPYRSHGMQASVYAVHAMSTKCGEDGDSASFNANTNARFLARSLLNCLQLCFLQDDDIVLIRSGLRIQDEEGSPINPIVMAVVSDLERSLRDRLTVLNGREPKLAQ